MEDHTLHIVLVNQWYPPDGGWGGTSAYAYHAAHAYVALGHRVSVIAAGEPDSGPDADSPNIAVRRLKPIAEPWWSRRIPFVGRYLRTVRHAVHSWRVSMAIARLDRTARIDVVEFPEVNAEGLFYVLRRRRAPVVIRCHTPHLLLKEGYSREECYFDFDLIWRMERMSIMRADAVTSPSRDLSGRVAEACGLPASQVATVPHPVPIIWSEDTGGTLEEHPLELLHVGRLERAKGVFTLVRAISIALARVPDLHVTFVGATRRTPSGERVDDVLRRMLSASGCLERVTFWGYVDQEHLSDFYARASMCVVPSELYESFSYTCAQGLAAGKPVIATRIGGIPEVVLDGECGLLVDPGNAQALASAIVRLSCDSELRCRMGQSGRARVVSVYDPETFAHASLSVYRQAAERQRA